MIKRLTSVALVCVLLSIFLVVPARAVQIDGSADSIYSYGFTLDSLGGSSTGSISLAYSTTENSSKYQLGSSSTYRYYGMSGLQAFSVPDSIEGNLVVALSYFYTGDTRTTFGSTGDYTPVLYWDTAEALDNTADGNWLSFEPVSDVSNHSIGITVMGTFSGTEDNPLTNPRITWDPRTCWAYINYSQSMTFYFPSFKVISTSAPSAELAELEEIAKGIAESNQILSAMYGDILAVCNAIYERNGSILEAQQMTNEYFKAIIPVLNSIASTTSNIYTLLGQQFALLISTIQSESDDIQATINAAIDKMIAYLDNAFSSSINPALPGQSTDISGGNTTVADAESGYQSSASERFEAISADFAGFDGSILSGVALGGTLFQRVWNVLGDYVIIYTFPLTLSICLVVVGRLSRNASRSRGSGGDKKKDGDGS